MYQLYGYCHSLGPQKWPDLDVRFKVLIWCVSHIYNVIYIITQKAEAERLL